MARKDALLHLHQRLTARRDSLRRKLTDEVDLMDIVGSGGKVIAFESTGDNTGFTTPSSILQSTPQIALRFSQVQNHSWPPAISSQFSMLMVMAQMGIKLARSEQYTLAKG